MLTTTALIERLPEVTAGIQDVADIDIHERGVITIPFELIADGPDSSTLDSTLMQLRQLQDMGDVIVSETNPHQAVREALVGSFRALESIRDSAKDIGDQDWWRVGRAVKHMIRTTILVSTFSTNRHTRNEEEAVAHVAEHIESYEALLPLANRRVRKIVRRARREHTADIT